MDLSVRPTLTLLDAVLPQTFDSARSIKAKAKQLVPNAARNRSHPRLTGHSLLFSLAKAEMIQKAKGKVVVHTGAGISTSAGVIVMQLRLMISLLMAVARVGAGE